jgi:undecaprenyl-diphosphatase
MLESLEMFDRKITLAINGAHQPWLDDFMWYASESWHTYLLALGFAWAFFSAHRSKVIWFIFGCLLVAGATDLTSNTMKHGIKRYRPTHNTEIGSRVRTLREYRGGQYSFISSHAANAFGLITFIGLCFRRRSWTRVLLFVYATVISYSRIYLGVHWAGFLLVNTYILKLHARGDSHFAAP